MTLSQQHGTFVYRYMLIIVPFTALAWIIGAFGGYNILSLTYNLPMLCGFAAGVHFYRQHNVSPFSAFSSMNVWLYVLGANAVFFAGQYYLFISVLEEEFNPESIYFKMQLWLLLGVGLSHFYFAMYRRKQEKLAEKKNKEQALKKQ